MKCPFELPVKLRYGDLVKLLGNCNNADYIVQAINSHEKLKGYFKNIILTAEGITGNVGDDDVLIAGIIDICKRVLSEAEKK